MFLVELSGYNNVLAIKGGHHNGASSSSSRFFKTLIQQVLQEFHNSPIGGHAGIAHCG